MGIVSHTIQAVRRTFEYSGRSTRAEFWWTKLVLFVLTASAEAFETWTILNFTLNPRVFIYVVYLEDILYLVTFLILISLTGRRWHDIGLPAWPVYLFFAVDGVFYVYGRFIEPGFLINYPSVYSAVIGLGLATLVVCIMPSQSGENRFGPNPHDPDPREVFA